MWYVFNPKNVPAACKHRLWSMTIINMLDVAGDMLYSDLCGKGLNDKPTEIPEGKTLRFFPESTDVAKYRARKTRKLSDAPDRYKRVPWEEDDEPRPTWAGMSQYYNVFTPLLTAEGKVEFYPSYQAQHEDKPEVVSIGRFLHTLWDTMNKGWSDYMDSLYGVLTDDMVRSWSEIPKALTPEDIKFAMTPDEIEEVYRTGPSSCMSKGAVSYQTDGVHPVRAYGAGDLAVAWLPKRRGPGAMQRALCWPEKKVYSRIYGTGPLKKFLQSLGFVEGKFHGARLLKHEIKGTGFLLPYIDYHNYVVERRDVLKIWHKEGPHPVFPEAIVTIEPRTKWNVWNAQGSTVGAVSGKRKCEAGCGAEITQQRVVQGWTICVTCEKTTRTCHYCGSRHRKDDVTYWAYLVGSNELPQLRSVKAIRKRCQQALCPNCVSPYRITAWKNDGYRVLLPEIGEQSANTHTTANAEV